MNDLSSAAGMDSARAAVGNGDFVAAIGVLQDLCRASADVVPDGAETLLAECRRRAAMAYTPATRVVGAPSRPAVDAFAGITGVPEIPAAQLDLGRLASGILYHGAVLVRGLLAAPRADELARGIERALSARAAFAADELKSPWYTPFDCWSEDESAEVTGGRFFNDLTGSVWAVDSPRMLREWIDLAGQLGLVDLIGAYFGERPWLSARKTTLRQIPATIKDADWHQDGAFLGSGIRSVNVWLALSDCGIDASGLDVVPRRLDAIVPTGTDGARFSWSAGPGAVARVAGAAGIASPHFAAGDALLFDHLFLHRTSVPLGIKRDRYAIESWFFAPSAYPAKQGALML